MCVLVSKPSDDLWMRCKHGVARESVSMWDYSQLLDTVSNDIHHWMYGYAWLYSGVWEIDGVRPVLCESMHL